jgi:phenylalanyl-tRNA synthetase alpha chain
LHEYQLKLLDFIKNRKESDVGSIAEGTGLSRDQVIWAVEALLEKKAVNAEKSRVAGASLTKEGREYMEMFPEERLVRSLKGPLKAAEIDDKIGLIWAKKNGWITLEGDTVKVNSKGMEAASKGFEYGMRKILNELDGMQSIDDGYMKKHADEIKALERRKLLNIEEKGFIGSVSITEEGRRMLESEESEGVGQLTKEMISSGSWKKMKFKRYDISAPAEESYAARLHPVREFINYVRHVWLDMGFVEVSGPIVESAFWNFDVLFSPQDHPTREMQDTFFLSNPKEISIEDVALLNRVKRMHKANWERIWKEELAKQALLRTQATSVSAHYIYKFANAVRGDYPVKLFSVGKVFRNESIDYKHLAELVQTDGIIIGDNLNLAHIIYTLKTFYQNLGFNVNNPKEFRFKPSYFPFVEPGLEAMYYDREKGDWIELVGAGIIRKEITKALGTSKTVLAWGAGLDRLFFKALDIDALTTLYKNDIGWLRSRGRLKL